MDQSEHAPRQRVGSTKSKGRGVFAGVPIVAGELIEAVPVIVIPAEQWHHIEPTVLALHIFNFGPEGEHAAIALGYGSLYNHSYLLVFIRDRDEPNRLILELIHQFVPVR